MLRGSRANDTPRPTQLCPQCRPLRTQQPIVGVFHRGSLHCGRHTNQSHARIASARGELHAKLGELSNDVDPHQHHTPHRRGGRRRTRAGLETQGLTAVRVVGGEIIASQISHVIYRGHFSRHPKNVAIPTMQIQCLNESSRNYVRNCWAHISTPGPTGVEGAGRTGGHKRAWLRCPWAVAGPGRTTSRRAKPTISTHGPTGVEGAGGTGGHGRASRRGAERSEAA